uniref:CSC1/OSCA1-like 7TM region domain-containing protein n=1 Tax=Petromyzon marinus TaxID=7757 RepID=S4R9Q0_PETMA
RHRCVFLPDNGAFFVNYVVTAALLGSAARLLRLPELALYGLRLCLARSDAHRHHVRKRCCYEFPYGLEYAWTMCIITVTMSYSVTCPIITPFVLLYSKLTLSARRTLCVLPLPPGLRRPITMFLTEVLGFAGATVLLWLLYKALKRLLRSRQVTHVRLTTHFSRRWWSRPWEWRTTRRTAARGRPQPCRSVPGAGDVTSTSTATGVRASEQLFVAEVLREPTLDLSLADSPSRHSYGSLAPNSPSEAQ